MRSRPVVVLHVRLEHTVKLAVERRPAGGRGTRREGSLSSARRSSSPRAHGCSDGPDALRTQHLVEGCRELGVVVVDQEADAATPSWSSQTRLRAAWAIQPLSGVAVAPSRRTTRFPTSITNRP